MKKRGRSVKNSAVRNTDMSEMALADMNDYDHTAHHDTGRDAHGVATLGNEAREAPHFAVPQGFRRRRLLSLVQRFAGKSIVIVGDMVADEYIIGRPERI